MGDEYRGNDGPSVHRGSAVLKYSRSEGVHAYRRRRRRSKAARVVVVLLLLCVLGGAAFLFGRQYVDLSGLPSLLPGSEAPSAPETTQPEEVPTVQPVTATVLGAGGVIMNNSVIESGRTAEGGYSFGHLFTHLTNELQQFDLRMVDQETSLAGSAYGFGYSVPLNAPQDLGRAEAEAGFNVILRASDHTMDTGREGVHNELLWWHDAFPQMPVLGIAEPDPEANPGLGDYVSDVYVYDKEGLKVAVLNHTWGVGEGDRQVVSALVEDKVTADVAKARELGANLIVACPHWGRENTFELSEEQTTFARIYAHAGVDVIVGSNPRVLQRVEVLQTADGHKTVCFYSLGCLVSSLYADNFVGGIAEVTLARDDQGACSVQDATLKPVVTHRASGQEYCTYLARDYSDELAQSSWDPGITPEDITRRCKEVLGDAYDAEACELRVDLNATVPVE